MIEILAPTAVTLLRRSATSVILLRYSWGRKRCEEKVFRCNNFSVCHHCKTQLLGNAPAN